MSKSAAQQLVVASDAKAEEELTTTSIGDSAIERVGSDMVKSSACDPRAKPVSTETGLEDIPMTFPQQLFEILRDKHSEGIIEWLPHGLGWTVRDKKRFASEVLPRNFSRQARFTSFTRRLNRWNFTRVTRGPEIGSYYHPLFRRDDPKLCLQMTCINSKSPQQLQPLDPVALGLGVIPMVLLPPSLPLVDSTGAPTATQPPDQSGALQQEGAETDAGGSTLSNGGETSLMADKVDAPAPPPTAGELTSADSLNNQAQLYSIVFSNPSQASSDADSSLTQPMPKVSPFQSKPLCLPPKPRKSARKGTMGTGSSSASSPVAS